MRRTFRRKKPSLDKANKEFAVNDKITSPELVVIDENGVSLGTISRDAALAAARDHELDLVEVSPKAVPPIAKIMDYGSYRYQREKSERKAKAKTKTIEVKTVKLSLRISEHDADVRAGQAIKFLADGDKVKIELQLRGRERQHTELARQNMREFLDRTTKLLGKPIKIEQPVSQQGGRLSMTVTT